MPNNIDLETIVIPNKGAHTDNYQNFVSFCCKTGTARSRNSNILLMHPVQHINNTCVCHELASQCRQTIWLTDTLIAYIPTSITHCQIHFVFKPYICVPFNVFVLCEGQTLESLLSHTDKHTAMSCMLYNYYAMLLLTWK